MQRERRVTCGSLQACIIQLPLHCRCCALPAHRAGATRDIGNKLCTIITRPCCRSLCTAHQNCIQVLRGVGATRDIGNKLTHEEPQKPSELPEELKPSHPGRAMDSDEKKVSLLCLRNEDVWNRNIAHYLLLLLWL